MILENHCHMKCYQRVYQQKYKKYNIIEVYQAVNGKNTVFLDFVIFVVLVNLLKLVICMIYFFIHFLKNLLIYFWLHWVFVATCGLSLGAASGGYSSLRCAGFSLLWLLLLRSMGSRRVGFSSCGFIHFYI